MVSADSVNVLRKPVRIVTKRSSNLGTPFLFQNTLGCKVLKIEAKNRMGKSFESPLFHTLPLFLFKKISYIVLSARLLVK